jgi:hypothetical protein
MSLLPFCQWLADTPGSIALHESLFMYPLVESAHVLTLCLFLGMAIMFDLRLLGLTLTRVPITEIAAARSLDDDRVHRDGDHRHPAVLRHPGRSIRASGFAAGRGPDLAGRTRSSSMPASTRVAEWDLAPVPPAARRAGATSLVLWAVIVVAGRMIAQLVRLRQAAAVALRQRRRRLCRPTGGGGR